MPLPDARGGVAFCLERAGNGDFLGWETACGIPIEHAPLFAPRHAGAYGQPAGQQRGPTGGANTSGHVEIGETHSFRRHAVEVWGADGGMTVAAKVAVAQVVGEDDDDIRER